MWWKEDRMVKWVEEGCGYYGWFVKGKMWGEDFVKRGEKVFVVVMVGWVDGWRKFDVDFERGVVLEKGKFEVWVDGKWRRVV